MKILLDQWPMKLSVEFKSSSCHSLPSPQGICYLYKFHIGDIHVNHANELLYLFLVNELTVNAIRPLNNESSALNSTH